MNNKFMTELAGLIKQVNEDSSYPNKPEWLKTFGGTVEDYSQDLARWLRVGLFSNNACDPRSADEVEALVRSGEIPTVWIDPLIAQSANDGPRQETVSSP